MNCNIARDLMPLYADGLVSAETAAEMKDHLTECEACRNIYEDMTCRTDNRPETQEKEIDYLKEIRNKNRRKVIRTSLITAAVMIGAAALFSVLCLIYYPADSGEVSYQAGISDGDMEVSFKSQAGGDLTVSDLGIDNEKEISEMQEKYFKGEKTPDTDIYTWIAVEPKQTLFHDPFDDTCGKSVARIDNVTKNDIIAVVFRDKVIKIRACDYL